MEAILGVSLRFLKFSNVNKFFLKEVVVKIDKYAANFELFHFHKHDKEF